MLSPVLDLCNWQPVRVHFTGDLHFQLFFQSYWWHSPLLKYCPPLMSKSKTLWSQQVIGQKSKELKFIVRTIKKKRSKSKIHDSDSRSQCRQKGWRQNRSNPQARGTLFDTRPRDAFQLCTLDQNRLRPPTTTQKLTGYIRLDELHSLAIGPAIQTEPTWRLFYFLLYYKNSSGKFGSEDILGKT